MKLHKIMAILVVAGLLMGWGVAWASPAKDQLKTSIDGILNILRDEALKSDGNREKRRRALRDIVYSRFDFRKMSQLSLARHWKGLSNAERETFATLFSQLLENTYIGRIEAYTNERVAFVGERVARRKVQVNTMIVTESIEIPINYRMFDAGGGNWQVYDLIIEGVSLVGNYRSQFGRFMEKNSFDALLAKLREKVATP